VTRANQISGVPIAVVRGRTLVRAWLLLLLGLLLGGCAAAGKSMAPAEVPAPGQGEVAAAEGPPVGAKAAAAAPAQAAVPGGTAAGSAAATGASYAPGVPRPAGVSSSPAERAGAEPGAGKLGKGSDAHQPPRGAKQAPGEAAKQTEPTIAHMLIYTAELGLMLGEDAFAATIDRVADVAASMGGYLAGHDNVSVQIRVPSARFRDALRAVAELGTVTHRSVQVQDVSEEFNDLEVRLKSLKATRDRLEQFLARAKDIQEVLNVEKELGRVNAEIDRAEGRMRFLASRAAYSTITVRLEPKPRPVVADPKPEPPPPPPPPPARTVVLPIGWLTAVGLDHLLKLD
jgi:hypothetical protein